MHEIFHSLRLFHNHSSLEVAEVIEVVVAGAVLVVVEVILFVVHRD